MNKKLARRRIGCPQRSKGTQWRRRASFFLSNNNAIYVRKKVKKIANFFIFYQRMPSNMPIYTIEGKKNLSLIGICEEKP